MQLVYRLVFMRSLKVHLDFSDQRQTVGIGDVQLLRFVNAVLLKTHRTFISHYTFRKVFSGKSWDMIQRQQI